MYFPPTLTLTERFAEITKGIQGSLFNQYAWCRAFGPLSWLIWGRLSRLRLRFAALAARAQAGTLPPPARPRRRPARPRLPAAPDQPRPPSRRSGWLIRMVPEPWHLNFWRNPLQELLDDPELTALLQAAPQLGRILRPLCGMLHMPLIPALALPPRPPRPRRKPARKPPRPVDVTRLSSVAYGNLVHPEREPMGGRPPNRIAYGRARAPPKRE